MVQKPTPKNETQKLDISKPNVDYPLLLGLPWTSVLPVRYRLDGGKKQFPNLIFFWSSWPPFWLFPGTPN